jgi:hypothetical protein
MDVADFYSTNGNSLSVQPATSSNFTPKQGVNLLCIAEEVLRKAGFEQDVPGPGVLISLGQNEVCLQVSS